MSENKSHKELIKLSSLLAKKGLISEAEDLLRVAKNVSEKEAMLQKSIFTKVLVDLGINNPALVVDADKGVATFVVKDMTIVGFPRFLERLMRHLYEKGTKEYELQKIDRSDPMKVYIKF